MKTKEQKRKEAIARLERKPSAPRPTETIRETWSRRLAEAKRLRKKFGFEQR